MESSTHAGVSQPNTPNAFLTPAPTPLRPTLPSLAPPPPPHLPSEMKVAPGFIAPNSSLDMKCLVSAVPGSAHTTTSDSRSKAAWDGKSGQREESK
jgi:hypothetical protein